jgi:hypothetical protein
VLLGDESPVVAESTAIESNPDIGTRATELVRTGTFRVKGTDHDGEQWSFEIANSVVTIRTGRRTAKTFPIKDFELKAASSDRKLLISAGPNLKISLKHPAVQGQVWEPYVVRDVCIIAVGLQKQRCQQPSSPRRRR